LIAGSRLAAGPDHIVVNVIDDGAKGGPQVIFDPNRAVTLNCDAGNGIGHTFGTPWERFGNASFSGWAHE
jgi:hypothetical protein